MIASHGYVVLQPNYRGSDNLGNAYMTAIVRNTVAGPSADILAGLDALARRPQVDASRVAVSGWSYGGELTSWLIGHDHRWRAAVSGRRGEQRVRRIQSLDVERAGPVSTGNARHTPTTASGSIAKTRRLHTTRRSRRRRSSGERRKIRWSRSRNRTRSFTLWKTTTYRCVLPSFRRRRTDPADPRQTADADARSGSAGLTLTFISPVLSSKGAFCSVIGDMKLYARS